MRRRVLNLERKREMTVLYGAPEDFDAVTGDQDFLIRPHPRADLSDQFADRPRLVIEDTFFAPEQTREYAPAARVEQRQHGARIENSGPRAGIKGRDPDGFRADGVRHRLDRGESDAYARKRSRPRRHGEKIDILQAQTGLLKHVFNGRLEGDAVAVSRRQQPFRDGQAATHTPQC